MPRLCTICGHSDRKKIEQAIAQGRALRGISQQYRVSPDALQRHKRHSKAAIELAAKKRETSIGESCMARFDSLYHRTEAILAAAEAAGKPGLALQAIGQARENLKGLYTLATMDADSGSLESFGDKAILEEVQRRRLKTQTEIVVMYGDRQREVESRFEMERRPQLPAKAGKPEAPAEVVKQEPEPPLVQAEIVRRALPAHTSLLSIPRVSVFGEDFRDRKL